VETDRCYARTRSYERVARSTDSLEEGTATAKRWTPGVVRARVAGAPAFSFDAPSKAVLEGLIAGYQRITGDPVRSPKKRNLVAACYRVHGTDFLPQVARQYGRMGTVTNLLGELRCTAPSSTEAPSGSATEKALGERPDPTAAYPHTGMPCPPEVSLRDGAVIYCEAHRPRFDPSSQRRYDRRSLAAAVPHTGSNQR
jgi:hypothetical protein